MTPSQLAVIHDALEEAGLNPDQIRRAISAIDAEEVDAVVTRSETRYDDRHFYAPLSDWTVLSEFTGRGLRTSFEMEILGRGPDWFRLAAITRLLVVNR